MTAADGFADFLESADPGPTCRGCGHPAHGTGEGHECTVPVGYDHLRGDHDCGCPGDPIRAAAGWLVDVGYPVDFQFVDHPAPQELWDAIVDVVTEDPTGRMHGNELTRDEVDAWLSDEAGRPVDV